jgi:hypothetical protein
VLAPSPSLYVDFPPDFGRRVIVTVDTEEEFDWSQPKRRDATSVEAVKALPTAHARLRDFGVKPAYLVDYPVATTPESVAILNRFVADGEASVGAQLHPWVNPPFDEPIDALHSFPGNLPRRTERAKLAELTKAIRTGFGVQPIIYRAGRYGIGPNTEALLDELGYRIDASVRPLFEYEDEGGPSFERTRPAPYWTGPERRILEVPLTTAFLGGLSSFGEPLFRLGARIPALRGLLARARLVNRVALTPEGIPLDEALMALRVLLDGGTRLISISFHSPSVEPGHTPYVRDAGDLRRFYAWFDGVFGFLAKAGVAPASVEEVLAAAESSR